MKSKDEVEVRLYEPRDEAGIDQLLRKTFPKWSEFKDSMGLWMWKYLKTPLRSIIVVAVAEDRIVGCNHELIFKAKLGSEVTSLAWGDDLAVDPVYRGRGLWNNMRDYIQETTMNYAKYSYSSTTNPIVVNSWIKRKVALLPFRVTRMLKTKNIDQLIKEHQIKNSLIVKLGYLGLKSLNQLKNIITVPENKYGDFQITQIKEFNDEINLFWDQVKDDYNFIIEKKCEYLNWRYIDNDRGKHSIMVAKNSDEILGYVVVGYREGSSEGQIEDLLAIKERLDVVDALFSVACDRLDDFGVDSVFYQVVSNHPYQEVSRRHGFIDTRSNPTISFDYIENWNKNSQKEIRFLKDTRPSQVYFCYSTTI